MAVLGSPFGILIVNALCLFFSLICAHAAPALEYDVKAAYLVSLFAYVEWPPSTAAGRTVCVLGRDPFGQLLDRTAEEYQPFRVSVRRLGEGQSFKGCSLLFVASGSSRRTARVLEEATRMGILTVGERDDSFHDGIIIVLETNERDKRVSIAINPENAKDCGFRVSSRLLAIARLMKTTESTR